jgi:hypothetical protein
MLVPSAVESKRELMLQMVAAAPTGRIRRDDQQRLRPRIGGEARLLVLRTYRDVDVDRTHPLSYTLAELRRSPHFARHGLRGLICGGSPGAGCAVRPGRVRSSPDGR